MCLGVGLLTKAGKSPRTRGKSKEEIEQAEEMKNVGKKQQQRKEQ